MTITQLVDMAEHIHDVEGYNLGASSSRDYRNAFWARVIGCAYWGHPVYNPTPDRQWHLKKADEGRPQTDDVATSIPSRDHWDCIPGAGANGYSFSATSHGPLPASQLVYPPPMPDQSGVEEPEPEPPHVCPPCPPLTYPPYEALGGDEGAKMITRVLEADYKRAGRSGLDGDCGGWLRRTDYDVLTGRLTVSESIAAHRSEWCAALGIPVTP